MKDKILEILLDKIKATPHDYYPTGIEGIPQSAREIADMVKAFTKWKDENSAVIFIRDGKEGRWYAHNSRYFTFDNLFTYWYDNIRKK